MAIISVKKPAWLQTGEVEQQMTVIPKERFLPPDMKKAAAKEAKASGRPAVAAMLNAGEEVIPANTVEDLGGSQGVTQAINKSLPPAKQLNPATDKGTVGAYTPGIRRMACGSVGKKIPRFQYGTLGSEFTKPSYAGTSTTVKNMSTFTPTAATSTSLSIPLAGTAKTTAIPAPATITPQTFTPTAVSAPSLSIAVPAPQTFTPAAVSVPSLSIAAPKPQAAPATVTPASVPAAVTAPTIAIPKPPLGELPAPRPTGIAAAAKKTTLAESPAAKEARMATMEDLQQRQAAEQIAASQKAAQAGQTGAAYQAAMGELRASQEGALGSASRDAAIANAQAAEGKLMEAATMALEAGDYSGVNNLMTQAGLPAVDFTKVQAKERQANLKAASDDLITIAEKFTESNPALAKVLMEKAFAMRGELYSSVAGVEFDPGALATALDAVDSNDYTNPQMQSLVGKVAPTILDWFGTAEGQSSTYSLINSPQASAIFKKIADGTATSADLTQLGTVMALMFDNRHGITMHDADMSLLASWGLWEDVTKPTASVRPGVSPSGQSPAPATAPVIPNIPVSSTPGVQGYQPSGQLAPVIPPIPVPPTPPTPPKEQSGNGLDISGATELTDAQLATMTPRERFTYSHNRDIYLRQQEQAAFEAKHPEIKAFGVAPFPTKGVEMTSGASYIRNDDGSTNLDGKAGADLSGTGYNYLGYTAESFDFEHETGSEGFLLFGPGTLHAVYGVDEDFYHLSTTTDSDSITKGSGIGRNGDSIRNRATMTAGMQQKFETMAHNEEPFTLYGHTYTIDTNTPIVRDVLVGTTSHTSSSGAIGSQNWYADGLLVTDENGFQKVITFPVFATFWDNDADKGGGGQTVNLGIKVWDYDNVTTQSEQV